MDFVPLDSNGRSIFQGRSKVSFQISTESVYHDFPAHAVPADVHGILMRVSSLEDTLKGKTLTYKDERRRPSKRQKYLLDIMRLVESHPELAAKLPTDILEKLRTAQED